MTLHKQATNRFPIGPLPAPWPFILAVVAVAYTGYLLYATHHPKPELLVGKNLPHDKTLHFLAYGALAALVSVALAARGAWNIGRARFVFFSLALFAAVDEITQPMFGRAAELLDWVYDGIGLAAGLAIVSAGIAACMVCLPYPRSRRTVRS